MKEIVIVSKGNNAVAYGEGVEIRKTSTTGVSANLLALNEVLKTVVPTEAGETHRIFLMDLIQGINSGYAIDYVKTGKQMNGTALNPEDLAGYKEFYELYAQRILNVRFNLVSYIPKMKNNESLKALRSKAYAILDSMPATNAVAPQVQATVLDPDKELRETLTQLMTDALKNRDMALYKELKAERDALKAPEVVGAPVSSASNVTVPTFDISEECSIDNVDFNTGSVDNTESAGTTGDADDKPIVFENASDNTPTWDATQTY
jgi:hypothetical protein